MKIVIATCLLLITSLNGCLFAQMQKEAMPLNGMVKSARFDPSRMTYDINTKRQLSQNEVIQLIRVNNNPAFSKTYDKYGEIDSLFIDSKNPAYGKSTVEIDKNLIPVGGNFYEFVFKTTTKETITPDKSTTINKIIYFQPFVRKPFFNSKDLAELSDKVAAFQQSAAILPILLVAGDIDDKTIDLKDFKVVINAHGFSQKFGMAGNTGVYIVVLGKDNKVIGNFKRASEVDLNKLLK